MIGPVIIRRKRIPAGMGMPYSLVSTMTLGDWSKFLCSDVERADSGAVVRELVTYTARDNAACFSRG